MNTEMSSSSSFSAAAASVHTVPTLSQFLYPYRVEKGVEHTHTSLGKPLGSYYIPSSSHSAFLKVYKAAIERGEDVFLTERHRHIGPVVVDLDFRFEPLAEEQGAFAKGADSATASSLLQRRHSGTIEGIVDAYCRAMAELIETPDEFDVYVTEKRSPSTWKGLVKDGLHILAPSVITRPALQLLLRKDVLGALGEVFKPLNLYNKVEDVVDEAVIERNNWMMYGSKKPGGEPYAVTRRYRYSYGKETPLRLVGAGEELPSLDYVELLSIRNKYDELRVREAQRDRAELFVAKLEDDRKRRDAVKSFSSADTSRVSPKSNNQCADFEQVCKLVDLLDPKRVETYDGWMKLGWCLRNIDHRLLEAWVEVSKRSPKYVEGECPRVWNTMRTGGLGVGTLHMWAKQDAPDRYRELLRTNLVGLIKACTGCAHYDVACVVHHLYKHEFVCCSIKPSQRWYEFRDHRWHECDGGHSLRKHLSTDVYREICAVAEQIVRRMGAVFEDDANQSEERKMLAENNKKLCDLALKLKTTKFKDDVMKECAELFYVERFENKLDANVDLLGFDNGVYDLEKMEFREGRPDDYVSFSTLIDYVPYAGDDHYVVKDINRYWESVHPNKEVRDYILKSISSCLSGRIREERFNIWTGSGCHAAGTKIMMIDGSTKNVEDVVIGDVLMGDDSKPRNVLKLHRGESDMWKIVPVKGEPFVVNGDHSLSMKLDGTVTAYRASKANEEWTVRWHKYDLERVIRPAQKMFKSLEAATKFREGLFEFDKDAVRPGDVVNVSVKNFLEKVHASDRRAFSLYRPDFVDFEPKATDSRLHPYVLGVWLGDGTTNVTQITSMDLPIVDRFRELLPKTVKMMQRAATGIGAAKRYNISKADGVGKKREQNDLAKALNIYGLLGDKHIPLEYRCNTREVRMQVLSGLLDTDGEYQKHTNQLSLTLKCEKLFDDTLSLARSLGFACYKSKIQKMCCNNGKVGTYFRMHIVGKGIEDIPVQLAHKKASPRTATKNPLLNRFKLERVDDGNYFGFETDKNHLFMMGDYVIQKQSNGKSISVNLLEKTLGNYCCKFPVTLLTQKRAVSNAATPEIARAKGRRFAVLQEPSEDERLNVGLMKELSGGDTVQTRELFKGPVEWKPQFKLFLLCNNLPNVPSDDGGTWRRIRVVEFGSKFCERPNPDKPNEFPMDPDLMQKLDGWREHFMAILLRYYKRYVDERKLVEPEAVLQCTRDYQKTNDHMAEFVDNCIEKVEGGNESLALDDVFFEFKEWVKADQVPIKVPKKGIIQKYLDRALNCKVSSIRGKAAYRGFKMRDKGGDGDGEGEGEL
jgi:P4 family phage/plasmid primase-like protien